MAAPNTKQTFGSALIGFGIQQTIADTTTYRLRHGNGFYGSRLGVLYQDKFSRVVPSSITHPNGDASRTCFAAAVLAWQNLSPAQKAVFNNLAQHIQHLAGYHLFIKRYMQDNYS